MCASISILAATLQAKPSMGTEALNAIVAIGCPEATNPLLNLLKRAETEEKKPDFFDDGGMGGVGGFGGVGGGGGGRTENRTKDKVMAALAPKIRQALGKLTGLQHDNHRDWSIAIASGAGGIKVTTVYLCSDAGKTYDVPPGKSHKCPYSTKSGHEDTLLKHRRD